MGIAMRLHVDEGHGGADSGAVSGSTHEDDLNLGVGHEVARFGAAQGWDIERTRSVDTFATLAARYGEANADKSDAFVSIHHDWKRGEQAVIYANSNDAREVKSRILADFINRRINKPRDGIPNGGIYADRRGLAVLKGTRMPAVIVEVARVVDRVDAKVAGRLIVMGICDFLGLTFVEPGAAKPKPPKPAAKPKHHKVLRRGDKGGEVDDLQRYLMRKGISVGRSGADGDFGPATHDAVVKYQKRHLPRYVGGVNQWDGVAGKRTWALIDAGK